MTLVYRHGDRITGITSIDMLDIYKGEQLNSFQGLEILPTEQY